MTAKNTKITITKIKHASSIADGSAIVVIIHMQVLTIGCWYWYAGPTLDETRLNRVVRIVMFIT